MIEPEHQEKPKLNRMLVDMAVMIGVFVVVIVGIQALQGKSPTFEPFAVFHGTIRTLQSLRGQ